eukprot:CAMPEP_0195522836 /NCGR_PEP_ID=MMETSP0794_2-20130614/21387_1 /TAXON_ID=515487 /ORGANISM="Stephanopyxis turris, Strain CCMP 815" /LENGTH=450 /DNA_ID=CAMNT_0040652685 /DNA_START=36 /DNA_END=1388 /DNA_ORIENTATION=+
MARSHPLLIVAVATTFFTQAYSFSTSPLPSKSFSSNLRSFNPNTILKATSSKSTDDGADDHDPSEQTQRSNEPSISRRQAFRQSSLILPALMIGTNPQILLKPTPSSAILVPFSDEKQTIVITGCNSGIGLDAAARMSKRGHKIVLACRTLSKAEGAKKAIEEEIGGGDRNPDLIAAECDLASLESIAAFSKGLKEGLGPDGKIDVLCLNAGLARNTAAKDVLRTKEGFELTVGTNHFGHFYLTQLLLPMVKQNTGKIVVTASAVHDPESPGGGQGSLATLGNLAGLEKGHTFDMVDGGSFDADKAYKDSKLCNVLFTRELQRRLDSSGAGINANCFSPGLIVGTGLFRDQNPVFTKLFDVAATNLLKVGESTHWGGGALEYMALDKTVGSKGGFYYNSPPGSSKYGENAFGDQFNIDQVSKEAMDNSKAKRLWELSEKLVGISATSSNA